MHLLVLSAFRRLGNTSKENPPKLSQCTFWCSVLSDSDIPGSKDGQAFQSQCTFWCSVLSD